MYNLNGKMSGEEEVKSNVFLGIIGAIIGALLGAALWVLVNQLGYIASIAGYAIIWCAYKGYTLFAKRKDMKAAVIATIASVAVLLCTHFLCWGLDLYTELEMTLPQAVLAVPGIVFNPEIIAADDSIIVYFFRDLLIGLLLIGIGAYPYFKHARRMNKVQNEVPFDTME